jgi:hypothetical protein
MQRTEGAGGYTNLWSGVRWPVESKMIDMIPLKVPYDMMETILYS